MSYKPDVNHAKLKMTMIMMTIFMMMMTKSNEMMMMLTKSNEMMMKFNEDHFISTAR